MEKISHIVRGNARVASTDLKNAAPVRPGAPAFGRPMGESTAINSSALTTAARAVALHNEIVEGKKARPGEEVIQGMANDFFMNRIRQPELATSPVGTDVSAAEGLSAPSGTTAIKPVAGKTDSSEPNNTDDDDVRFTPRGSFVDVRA